MSVAYTGTERRIHRVFVTRNTEYHVRGETCVAVRDRRSGEWLPSHQAVHQRLRGALRFSIGGGVVPNTGTPQQGESLYFCSDDKTAEIVTSAVESVERPSRDVVRTYASLTANGASTAA